MDSLITAAARALAAGDPLAALKRVALRDDPAGLALRGIAIAQLGDLERARSLLKRAARGFSHREAVARARCTVAEAEIALVSRDLAWPAKALSAARAVLEANGDRVNAAHARNLEARRLLLIGQLDEAEKALGAINGEALPPIPRAGRELAVAGIAIRRLRTAQARAALARAGEAARAAGIAALEAEVASAASALNQTAARLIAKGTQREIRLDEVEAVLSSGALVIDACRNIVRGGDVTVSLTRRPVLFALARALAEAWPEDVARAVLLKRAFGARHADESHRARLRVELGRLRKELGQLATVHATRHGFALVHGGGEVLVLAPPIDEAHGEVLALLADGEAWSSSALSMALGASPRTVQRSLSALSEAGKVQSFGRARARRWTLPSVPGFPTSLLLPGPLPGR